MLIEHGEEIFRTPKGQDSPYGFAVWQSRPVIVGTFHQHNDIEVNAMDTGTMSYIHGGSLETIHPREVAIFWAARPHQVLGAAEDAFCRGLTVPLSWLLSRRLAGDYLRRLLHGEILFVRDQGLVSDLDWLTREMLDDIEAEGEARQTAMHVDVEAWFRRAVLAMRSQEASASASREQPARGAAAPAKEGYDKVESIVRYISEHYTEPIGTDEIAEAVDLDRDRAMHLFHRVTGSSIVEVISQQRLAHALLLLVTTDMAVLDIAMEAGFGSASCFYSVFKETKGVPPTEYRERFKIAVSGPEATRGSRGAPKL